MALDLQYFNIAFQVGMVSQKTKPIMIIGRTSSLRGIVTYLRTEGTLYAQKSVPSWFLAVFDSKSDEC